MYNALLYSSSFFYSLRDISPSSEGVVDNIFQSDSWRHGGVAVEIYSSDRRVDERAEIVELCELHCRKIPLGVVVMILLREGKVRAKVDRKTLTFLPSAIGRAQLPIPS